MRLSVARHPIITFQLIGNGVYLAAALSAALVESKVLPFDLPLFAAVGTILGVGLAAFVVTGAADGWAGATDLARRTLRWRGVNPGVHQGTVGEEEFIRVVILPLLPAGTTLEALCASFE